MSLSIAVPSPSGALTLHTPAKVNLTLDVLRRREDGFHELQTLMTSIDLRDTLHFEVLTPEAAETSGPVHLEVIDGRSRAERALSTREIPTDERNLVVKAAHLLRNWAGENRGVRIRLVKRIPAAAGLAGGSTDAAATLSGVARIWGLRPSISELFELGGELGSDINFFLQSASAAVCTGRGEQITPLDAGHAFPLVVVCPNSGLSTPAVFKECRPVGDEKGVAELVDHWKNGRVDRMARDLRNSLQPSALRLNPELHRVCQSFDRSTVSGHQMSGSGTSWFGLCRSTGEARYWAGRFRTQLGCRAFATRTGTTIAPARHGKSPT